MGEIHLPAINSKEGCMDIKYVSVLFVIIMVCVIGVLHSNTIIIKLDGSGDYTSIQEGIDNSVNGDTVLVYPGTYFENINYNGKNITVASLYINTLVDSFIQKTIIDGNHNGSVVTFESGEDTTAVLCGFTIQNGSGTEDATYFIGGGIYCTGSSPYLKSCTITNNKCDYGGGILLDDSELYLTDIFIFDNVAYYQGGGIEFFSFSSPHFSNENRCNVYLNYSGSGSDFGLSSNNNDMMYVVLDTFTVLEPTEYYVSNLDLLNFDIQNCKIEQIDQDLYVNPNGNNSNSGQTPSDPLKSISWAMTVIKSDSLSKNKIYLSPGIYSQLYTNEKFPINCKSYVSVIGSNSSDIILKNDFDAFLVCAFNKRKILVENITLKDGYTNLLGGGIFTHNISSDIIFKNMIINNCSAYIGGGGISCFINSSPIFENVVIKNNSSNGGGGIDNTFNSNPVFINCIIDSNYTITPDWGYAGGVSCTVESNPIFINSAITNNVSDQTSGFSASGGAGSFCDPTLINCTICDNSDNNYGAIYQGDGSHISLINCILRNYSEDEVVFSTNPPAKKITVSYSNIKDGIDAINTNNNGTIIWGNGNIDEDPLFAGGDPFSYELTKYSPCIDAGTPDTTGLNLPSVDLAGNGRIYNGRIDIGCYEFQGYGIDEPDTSFIHNLYLFQNTPNPFTNETEILFITADYERVEDYTLSIYNTKGQLVRRFDGLTNNFWVKTKIIWDGTDEQGKQVASGTYLYKLEYNGHAVVRKMTLLR